MKTKYLAYAQACAISKDYQYLKGDVFGQDHRIDIISVAPYSRILQWQFVSNLLKGMSTKALLDANHSGKYDVIAVARTGDEQAFKIIDLRSLLVEKGVAFDPARYNCLRNHNIPPGTLRQLFG